MLSKQLYEKVYQTLWPVIGQARECQAITQQLLSHYFRLTPIHNVLNTAITISVEQEQHLRKALQRLENQEPIQYILGEALFLDNNFQVNPTVLIPRPETEALVQDIIDDKPTERAHILDLGTGSGCIAITLRLIFRFAQVWALDFDPLVLRTAQANAQRLGAEVRWIRADLLQDYLPNQRWDIMVSNPPYVRLSEKQQMHRRVLDYEPAQSLFVTDERPLIFHERIVGLASQHLTSGGRLYLEINEAMGSEVARLFEHAGFETIRIKQDLSGRDRWVKGIWRP